MDLNDIEQGVELDEFKNPEVDILRSFADILTPWIILVLWITIILSIVTGLQQSWSGSPLFLLIGVLGVLIFGLIAILIGLLVLIVSGNTTFIGNAFGIFINQEWYDVMFPFTISIIGLFFTWSIPLRIHLDRDTKVVIMIVGLSLILIFVMAQFPCTLFDWMGQISGLIVGLFK